MVKKKNNTMPFAQYADLEASFVSRGPVTGGGGEGSSSAAATHDPGYSWLRQRHDEMAAQKFGNPVPAATGLNNTFGTPYTDAGTAGNTQVPYALATSSTAPVQSVGSGGRLIFTPKTDSDCMSSPSATATGTAGLELHTSHLPSLAFVNYTPNHSTNATTQTNVKSPLPFTALVDPREAFGEISTPGPRKPVWRRLSTPVLSPLGENKASTPDSPDLRSDSHYEKILAESPFAASPTVPEPLYAKFKAQSLSRDTPEDVAKYGNIGLPSMATLRRAPMTALKEVRAELQKTFPGVSSGSTNASASKPGYDLSMLESFYPKPAYKRVPKDKINKHAIHETDENLAADRALERSSERSSERLLRLDEIDGKLRQLETKTLFDQFEASLKAKDKGKEVAKEDAKGKAKEKQIEDSEEVAILKAELDKSWSEVANLRHQLQAKDAEELNEPAATSVQEPVTKALSKAEKLQALLAESRPIKSPGRPVRLPAHLQEKDSNSTQAQALPFALTSDFKNPESFAELNKRLRFGSRLSAFVSTSLEDRAGFRARWESMASALPRNVGPEDFVQLVTPGSSPTSPEASTQATPPMPPVKPVESLTEFADFYNKRFESLGKEAKEMILKASKTWGPPPAKKTVNPADYTEPFCTFLTENPTIFHTVDYFATKLTKAGFEKLSERNLWTDTLKAGGKYFVERNGSSLIAFSVGKAYKSGNGVAMIGGHVDALSAKLKPVSTKKTKAGYVQLGVAPYAGALNSTWWDRDLGVGGRVLVKDEKTGKISSKLVKLGHPIARIPTLAPHFGVGIMGNNNAETQAVPIIGLDNSDLSSDEKDAEWKTSALLGGSNTFAATQPPKLLKAIAGELNIQNYSSIVQWELELFDTQPAQVGGLEKEFIFAGRIDDKICSWAAMEALLAATEEAPEASGIISLVGVFDDEEIGSQLRQGAKSNFLPSIIERITESFSKSGSSSNVLSQTYANSFLISADVTHAANPNFLEKYLEGHAPRLNIGVTIAADSNGHMTTDSVSTTVVQEIAEKSGSDIQLFMIRNDSRSGGTIGPVLSSMMGVRAIDMGIPQLSMHSIRATTGSLDPGLGVKLWKTFFTDFEAVDGKFE